MTRTFRQLEQSESNEELAKVADEEADATEVTIAEISLIEPPKGGNEAIDTAQHDIYKRSEVKEKTPEAANTGKLAPEKSDDTAKAGKGGNNAKPSAEGESSDVKVAKAETNGMKIPQTHVKAARDGLKLEKPYQCQNCNKRFKLPNGLANHKIRNPGCDTCDTNVEVSGNLEVDSYLPYRCSTCKRHYRFSIGLQYHLKNPTLDCVSQSQDTRPHTETGKSNMAFQHHSVKLCLSQDQIVRQSNKRERATSNEATNDPEQDHKRRRMMSDGDANDADVQFLVEAMKRL